MIFFAFNLFFIFCNHWLTKLFYSITQSCWNILVLLLAGLKYCIKTVWNCKYWESNVFENLSWDSKVRTAKTTSFYTPPLTCGRVLWFHVGHPWVCSSVSCTSGRQSIRILFPDDILNKHQWIFTKLGVCIDIAEIWFGIANGHFSSNFDGVICPRHAHIFVSRW